MTDKKLDQMQNYFGEAIRNNVGDLEGMRKAIWAIFHHMIKNDNETLEEQHRFCPKDGWCKFWKSKATYKDSSRLPFIFQGELKPIFERLSSNELLQRCLKGYTQNQNEAINHVLWNKRGGDSIRERVLHRRDFLNRFLGLFYL